MKFDHTSYVTGSLYRLGGGVLSHSDRFFSSFSDLFRDPWDPPGPPDAVLTCKGGLTFSSKETSGGSSQVIFFFANPGAGGKASSSGVLGGFYWFCFCLMWFYRLFVPFLICLYSFLFYWFVGFYMVFFYGF